MSEKEKRFEELLKEWTKKIEPKLFSNVDEGKEKPSFQELLNRFENRYYFFVGIVIGIFFGILGNLLATNLMELIRVEITSPGLWVLINAIMLATASVGTVLFLYWIWKRMKSDREVFDKAKIELLREALFKTNVPPPEELRKLLNEDAKKDTTP